MSPFAHRIVTCRHLNCTHQDRETDMISAKTVLRKKTARGYYCAYHADMYLKLRGLDK